MKTNVITVGKTQQSWIKDGLEKYWGRLKHYGSFEWQELPDVKGGGKLKPEALKIEEGKSILKAVSNNATIVLLDEKGKSLSSRQFASFFEQHQNRATRELVLVIGGAFGFSDEVYQAAQGKISLSAMTFNHQMIRPFLAEQVYRAHTILRGEKYHND